MSHTEPTTNQTKNPNPASSQQPHQQPLNHQTSPTKQTTNPLTDQQHKLGPVYIPTSPGQSKHTNIQSNKNKPARQPTIQPLDQPKIHRARCFYKTLSCQTSLFGMVLNFLKKTIML